MGSLKARAKKRTGVSEGEGKGQGTVLSRAGVVGTERKLRLDQVAHSIFKRSNIFAKRSACLFERKSHGRKKNRGGHASSLRERKRDRKRRVPVEKTRSMKKACASRRCVRIQSKGLPLRFKGKVTCRSSGSLGKKCGKSR